MGRKATLYLCDRLLTLATAALFVTACMSRYGSSVSPLQGGGWFFFALAAPMICLLCVAGLVFWLLRRRWITALLPLAGLAVLYPFLAASCRLRLPQGPGPCDLKVVTFNVNGFRGDGGFRSVVAQAAELLRDEGADVVCLDEFRVSRDYDTLRVASMFGMPYYAACGSVVVLSRHPIVGSLPVPFDTGGTNNALSVDIDTPSGGVRVLACHLQTTGVASLEYRYARESGRRVPFGVLAEEMEAQARLRTGQIERLVRLAGTSPRPIVLAGDFNDLPSSYTYHAAAQALSDTFREGGSGWGGTFRRAMGLLRLDYVFVSGDLDCRRCYTVRTHISDHKPVFAELDFR